MEKKDYFSGHAKLYAAFRPDYPAELYEFIFKHLPEKNLAWDCATGNGQVAEYLSKHFQKVYATDISQQQLDNAFKANNIIYSVNSAEKTFFADNQFDLITVAQALHWFDFDAFYTEVNRVSKNNSLLAVWGYGLCSVDVEVDKLFLDFYSNTLGPYWDKARKLIENSYQTIPFPFEQIQTPEFAITVEWNLEQYTGYLSTWSATQKYIRENNHDPVIELKEKLQKVWRAEEVKQASFPVFLKLGKIVKHG